MSSLTGGIKLSKRILSSVYQQMLMDVELCEYTTINTHHGLYCYTHLPFGIASAPDTFQKAWIASYKGYSMSFATWMTSW